MMTRDEMTEIITKCTALQVFDAPVGYDTEIVIDSFGFVWLQHLLEERFGFALDPPDSAVLETLTSARAVHRYLAELSPDRFGGAVPVDGDHDPVAASALNPEFEAVLRECLDGLLPPGTELRPDSDLAELGIDSLVIIRLLVAIEDVFLVRIPDEVIAFEIFTSPGALWTVIAGLREEPRGH